MPQPAPSPERRPVGRPRSADKRVPWKHWTARPVGLEAIPRLCGVAAYDLALHICERAEQLFQRTGSLEVRLPEDDELVERLKFTRQTLLIAKKALFEKRSIFRWTGRKRTCVLDEGECAKLRTESVEPRKCTTRTKPEPDAHPEVERVMVRLPGTFQEVPVDDACAAHGGKGAACSCPLHRISGINSESFVDSKEVDEDRCKVNLPSHSPSLRPLESPPKVVAASSPAESGDQSAASSISETDLLTAIEPLCYDVFQRSPRGGRLMWETGCALGGWHGPALPFLIARIEACKGNARKKIGLLPLLAKDAMRDYRAARPLVDAAEAAARSARQREEGRLQELAERIVARWADAGEDERGWVRFHFPALAPA